MEVPTLAFVKGLAREAGKIAREKKIGDGDVRTKLCSSDLVTDIDLAVEKFLKESITARFPDHKFLCEESAAVDQRLTEAPTWVIDPIDGTTNFVHGLPLFTVSIGYCVDKVPKLGVVYNVMMDAMHYAERGSGAFLQVGDAEPTKLKTSGRTQLRECLTGSGQHVSISRKIDEQSAKQTLSDEALERLKKVKGCAAMNVQAIVTHCRDFRALGCCSVALCYVASGQLDCYCELGVKEWDMAAGNLLIEEAGGHVCEVNGKPIGDMHGRSLLVASSKEAAESLCKVLESPTFGWADLDNA